MLREGLHIILGVIAVNGRRANNNGRASDPFLSPLLSNDSDMPSEAGSHGTSQQRSMSWQEKPLL